MNSKLIDTTKVSTVSANVEAGSDFEEDMLSRIEAFNGLKERLDVAFLDIEIESTIKEISLIEENKIVVSVYERTMIEYSAADGTGATDVMGYGTDHILTLELISGEFQVVADSYDERFITGACSHDIVQEEENVTDELKASSWSNELPLYEETSVAVNAVSASYDVDAAVQYANLHCGVSENGEEYAYNPDYLAFEGDCANFLSQCLVAGGFTTDSIWYAYSDCWVNARYLAYYLTGRLGEVGYSAAGLGYGYAAVNSSYSNVYRGNPVYWLNPVGSSSSGHQMICVGTNTLGQPVVNAHTNDAYRMPVSLYASDHDLYTIYIVGG